MTKAVATSKRPQRSRTPDRIAAAERRSVVNTSRSDAPPRRDSADTPNRLRDHRRRQISVAAILDQTFGRLAECAPDLWDRRAYLMLVGLVYEHLATNEEELETGDLIALAKTLAEVRRAEMRSRSHAGTTDVDQSKAETNGSALASSGGASRFGGPLPKQFADVVRQIYGISAPESAAASA